MMAELLAVALGSAMGGLCRFHLTAWLDRRVVAPLSIGTLTVNVAGAFLLGVLVGLGGGAAGQPMLAALAMTGFCGSFTTVSSWALQTVTLMRGRGLMAALANLLITLVAGLGAVGLGLALTGGPG